jgi:hypothetical protein
MSSVLKSDSNTMPQCVTGPTCMMDWCPSIHAVHEMQPLQAHSKQRKHQKMEEDFATFTKLVTVVLHH